MPKPDHLTISIAQFEADTANMSTSDVGAYMLLLVRYAKTGSIPTEKKKLQEVTRLAGNAFYCAWEQERSRVRPLFDVPPACIPAAAKTGLARFGDIRVPYQLRKPEVLEALNRWAEHSWLAGQWQFATLEQQMTEFAKRGGAATIEIIERSIRDGATRCPYWEQFASSTREPAMSPEDRRRARHRRSLERRQRLLDDQQHEPMSLDPGEPSMVEQLKAKRAERNGKIE